MQNFDDNIIIIKGIKNIINNLNPDSLIRKYINLIDILIKNFNEKDKILCELLVTNPNK